MNGAVRRFLLSLVALLILSLVPLQQVLADPYYDTLNDEGCVCLCSPMEYYESIECGGQYLTVYYDPCICCGQGPSYVVFSAGQAVVSIPYYEYDEFKRMCHLESWSLFGPTQEIPLIGVFDIIRHILCLLDPQYC